MIGTVSLFLSLQISISSIFPGQIFVKIAKCSHVSRKRISHEAGTGHVFHVRQTAHLDSIMRHVASKEKETTTRLARNGEPYNRLRKRQEILKVTSPATATCHGTTGRRATPVAP